MIERITGEQVLAAMVASNITHVDHHNCGLCESMVYYHREGDQLFFNSGCDCSWSPARPCDWGEAADWINMQTTPEWRNKLLKAFGLPAEQTK